MSRPCPTPEKRGYRTKRYAKQQLRKIQSGSRTSQAKSSNLYRCVCGSWHHSSERKQDYASKPRSRYNARSI